MFHRIIFEKIKTHVLCPVTFFFSPENRTVCEIMWKNVVQPEATDGNIIRRTRNTCWTTKPADRHTQHAILIAVSRQQWLRERASVLRYTYIAGLVLAICDANTYREPPSTFHNVCTAHIYQAIATGCSNTVQTRIVKPYSRTPLTWINWNSEPSGYAENPDNWIFICK